LHQSKTQLPRNVATAFFLNSVKKQEKPPKFGGFSIKKLNYFIPIRWLRINHPCFLMFLLSEFSIL